jgi:hypothetical protein
MVTAWAYGHDVSRLDTRSEGAISETGDANPRLSAEKILALPCGKTQWLCHAWMFVGFPAERFRR